MVFLWRILGAVIKERIERAEFAIAADLDSKDLKKPERGIE